jgi:Uma2 family endonuclease
MMAVPSKLKPATLDDLRASDDPDRIEIVSGVIVEKAMPSPAHAHGESRLAGLLHPFDRRPGHGGPGGWWIMIEIHVEYAASEIHCHDAAGWRRERSPSRPTGWPVTLRPDWVCEIVSPKHERRDHVDKPRVLHVSEVPYYWLVDPEEKILLVQRWTPAGYVVILRATSGDVVRAEPFGTLELVVAELFGDEADE